MYAYNRSGFTVSGLGEKTQRIHENLIGSPQLGIFFYQPALVLGKRRVAANAAADEGVSSECLSLLPSFRQDITQIRCQDGKLYITAVLDCYNREIVGLAMDYNMKKALCIRFFRSACQAQGVYGMILHSDRGNQFSSAAFRMVLAQYGVIQNMSGTGRCYDNAMESFFCYVEERKTLSNQDGRCLRNRLRASCSGTS